MLETARAGCAHPSKVDLHIANFAMQHRHTNITNPGVGHYQYAVNYKVSEQN
jgi:hypothetical protein